MVYLQVGEHAGTPVDARVQDVRRVEAHGDEGLADALTTGQTCDLRLQHVAVDNVAGDLHCVLGGV